MTFERTVARLEDMAVGAEQRSEWPDRKDTPTGASLKNLAAEYRRAAETLKREHMMGSQNGKGPVHMAGRDHPRHVADSIATTVGELIKSTLYQQGIIEARDTELVDAVERYQEAESFRDRFMDMKALNEGLCDAFEQMVNVQITALKKALDEMRQQPRGKSSRCFKDLVAIADDLKTVTDHIADIRERAASV